MFIYFASYSDGWRSGTLTKFSRKGYIFKTWEGEIYQRGAEDASLNIMNKAWNFSVEDKQKNVIKISNIDSNVYSSGKIICIEFISGVTIQEIVVRKFILSPNLVIIFSLTSGVSVTICIPK